MPPSSDLQYPKPSKAIIEPPVTVQWSVYFAIGLLRKESIKNATCAVITAAAAEKILFRKLQVLDTFSIGNTPFIRFRADIKDIDPIIKRLSGRAFVTPIGDAFIAQFLDGRKGKCATSLMCSTPKIGFGQFFHGTRVKRWKFQFKED